MAPRHKHYYYLLQQYCSKSTVQPTEFTDSSIRFGREHQPPQLNQAGSTAASRCHGRRGGLATSSSSSVQRLLSHTMIRCWWQTPSNVYIILYVVRKVFRCHWVSSWACLSPYLRAGAMIQKHDDFLFLCKMIPAFYIHIIVARSVGDFFCWFLRSKRYTFLIESLLLLFYFFLFYLYIRTFVTYCNNTQKKWLSMFLVTIYYYYCIEETWLPTFGPGSD